LSIVKTIRHIHDKFGYMKLTISVQSHILQMYLIDDKMEEQLAYLKQTKE
jgi:hypothetical protein